MLINFLLWFQKFFNFNLHDGGCEDQDPKKAFFVLLT